MNKRITQILDEMATLEKTLQEEIEKQETKIGYQLKNGLIAFEKNIVCEHKKSMKSLIAYFKEIPFLHLISSPIIYAMLIPAIIFDILLFIYQQSIFRIYHIKMVKRSDYIIFDRHYLAYLNIIEKINCLYCSYFNGLMAFALEVAAHTELYFCPIKHAKKSAYRHSTYKDFFNYGDAKAFEEELETLRAKRKAHHD
ncbi:MAG: hypothetical protein K0U47_06310 [Epsilonproteobacteria bacterium]|nr:hypothetical protein [Campylobacterota bacterium]